MHLTKHRMPEGARWALDGRLLPPALDLGVLLSLPQAQMAGLLEGLPPGEVADGPLLAPVDPLHEVWAAGVTYLRSRKAREAESHSADVYERVYDAVRPELFFKASGPRVVGAGQPIRIREDSRWNVPEPELVVLANARGQIVGYTAGNDVSSRDIEGENPLYLPQAKIYRGSCALGPGVEIVSPEIMRGLPVHLQIRRDSERDSERKSEREKAVVFEGETSLGQMKRRLEELVGFLFRELDFAQGVWLMTGTGIVPPDEFTLQAGDVVRVQVGTQVLENEVSI